MVDQRLIADVETDQFVGDLHVDILDCLQHPLAEIPRLVVRVTQFDRLMRAGAGSAGDGRSAAMSVFRFNVHFHCRIAAAVENLASTHGCNFHTHRSLS